jgi:hypothetical protein
MTKYLSAIIGLAAAVIGVIGGTSDAAAPGLQRITPLGWGAVAAAIVSFGIIIFETRRDRAEIRWQESQRARVVSAAHAELRLAIRHLSGLFLEVFGDEWSEFSLVPKQVLSRNDRMRVAETDLRAPGPYSRGDGIYPAWWQLFQDAASESAARIDRALQIYATYLDSECLALISDLRTSEFFAFRLLKLGEHIEMNKEAKGAIRFVYVEDRDVDPSDMWGYAHFWRIVMELDRRLEKDEARLRRRT